MDETSFSTFEKIKASASNLFEKKGYAHTTVDEICQAAGVTKPTFYYYFKSKKELQSAPVYHAPQTVESSNILLGKIIKADSNWKKYYFLSVDPLTRCNYALEPEKLRIAIIECLKSNDNFFSELSTDLVNERVPLILEMQERGEVTNTTQPALLVKTLYDGFVGATYSWAANGNTSRFDLFCDILFALERILDVKPQYCFELSESDVAFIGPMSAE